MWDHLCPALGGGSRSFDGLDVFGHLVSFLPADPAWASGTHFRRDIVHDDPAAIFGNGIRPNEVRFPVALRHGVFDIARRFVIGFLEGRVQARPAILFVHFDFLFGSVG